MSSPSWQDIYDVGQYVLQARRPSLIVNPGDVTDAFIAGCATMVEVGIAENAVRFRSTYLDGADGDDLTEEARDRGVERDEGDPAVGTVKFARISAAAGAGTIGKGFKVGSIPDLNGGFATYTTDVDAVFSASDLTKSVTATCTKTGPEGNVAVAKITRMLGSAFDGTITVTNEALFAGGASREEDPDLRDRTRGFFLTQARGTLEALIYGAKQVAGVKRASIFVDPSTGIVTLYVADADGNSNAAMVAAVDAIKYKWGPLDSIINVVGATLLLQALDLSLTVRAGIDIAALLDRVRNAVVSRVARLQPGETLYRDMITAAARDVDKTNILSVVLNTPAANVTPTVNQVIRTTANIVTFT